jgi:hypothetical protein
VERQDERRNRELHRAIAELQEYLASFGVKKPQRPERPDPVARLWPDVRPEQPPPQERSERVQPGISQDLAELRKFLASVEAGQRAKYVHLPRMAANL